jgi:hypothetical protein
MPRKIAAVLLGVITAFALVAVIQKLGHLVYPPPADLSLDDPERWKAYVAGLPPGPFFFVLAAWALGTLGGGLVAARIARQKPLFYALIVGAVVMIASIAQLVAIPHPLWFTIAAFILIPAAAYVAAQLASAPA